MKKQIIILTIIALFALFAVAFTNNVMQLTAHIMHFRIFVNGEEKHFENPIITINDRVYIPLREVSELLGMDVEWDDENNKITINSKKLEEPWEVLYRFEQNGLNGFMDAFGNVVITPQFILALHDFFGEFVTVVAREWWWDENVLITGTEGPFVFINRMGQNAFGQEFLYASNFDHKVARVTLLNGNVIFINKKGENAFGQEFRFASQFNEKGLANVTLLDGRNTFINREGEITGENW